MTKTIVTMILGIVWVIDIVPLGFYFCIHFPGSNERYTPGIRPKVIPNVHELFVELND
jgi:hypothetical protein